LIPAWEAGVTLQVDAQEGSLILTSSGVIQAAEFCLDEK
jgi:hypothetical protein